MSVIAKIRLSAETGGNSRTKIHISWLDCCFVLDVVQILIIDYLSLLFSLGYYAFRNSVYGSWFIQALNNGLRKYGHILDLMSILTRVNYEVAFEFESLALTAEYSGKKQVPSVVSTLTKDVFFPPKTPPSEPVPSTSCSCPPTP